jgi:hypothetical protein
VTDPAISYPAHAVTPRPVEETVILRGEGGQWMHVGTDAARGIWHEGLSLSADRAGPSTCSFTLRRDPRVSWPDLAPFNECIAEIGGVRVWSGRMREAPGQSGASNTIAFTGSGWQSHLDDDLMAYGWVHSRLGDWRDWNSFPQIVYGTRAPYGLVAGSDGGELRAGWSLSQVIKNDSGVGFMIDLGQHHPPAKYIVAQVSMDAPNPWTNIYLRGTTGGLMLTAPVYDAVIYGTGSLTARVKTTLTGTFSTACRYVSLFVYRPGGLGDQTATTEHVLRIHRITLFSDPADVSAGESVLKASTVIGEVVGSGRLPQLSTDTSRIEATSFNIPDYWPTGHRSPRELIEPVNAFHDYDLGVDVDRRVFFRAPASAASLEVGAWSGAEFTDASAGSGEDVFNKVIVSATDATGQQVEVVRTAATAVPELASAVIVPGFPDGGFETGSTGWTLSNVVRSNSFGAHSGSWALINSTNVSPTATVTATGLIPGMRYALRFWWLRRLAAGGGAIGAATVTIGGVVYTIPNHSAFDVWDPVEIAFDAPSPSTSIVFSLPHTAANGRMVDGVRLERLQVNVVDRQGFARAQRLPISAPLTVAAAEVLGDVWLRNHIRTPLKGSVTVTGQGGVREALGGAPVHPAHLLLRVGEVMRHTGMADPDTGAWGRNGRIASVSYSAGRATVELDNERHRLEALIARYAALAGQVG